MHCSELAMPFPQMESWSCVAGGKGLVPHDMMSPSSIGGGRSKNAAISWDLSAATSGFDRDMMVSSHNVHASNGVGGMGFQELSTRQFSDNSCGNVMIDGHFAGVNGSSSNFAHPMLSAHCHDSLLVDLRLGRFLPDIMEGHNSRVPQVIPSFSSPGSSMPQKRIRSGGISSQVAYCQVYGCNKNLSSCKNYHKRHKVCEVHSKTPNVIVNGIEQRFCQQCSRFHLLAEFDDSKRSCRKRLSGHNARRRKPQVSVQAGRIGRLLQPYIGPGGNLFHTNSSRASSLIYPDIIFSGSLLNSDQGVGTSNLSGCIKVEDGNIFASLPSVPNLDSKCPYSSYERPFNFFHDGVTSAPSVIFTNNNQCQRDLGRRNSTCHYSFQEEASIGTEDYTIFDTASTVQVLSGISKSGCARSLLSSQSRSSSSHSSGIPMAQQPLIATGTDYQSTSHAYNRGLSDKASS